jgi:SAM-dependent methyltransferase
MKEYGDFAAAYDGLMEDARYARRAEFLDRVLRREKSPVRTVLDLGCGTGTIACLLAERGYQVIAVDASEDMLAEAAQKAAALEQGQPPFFVCQGMERLDLGQQVDAAVSTLDAINYLTRQRDLEQTFARVSRHLRPGGRFLFDVNSPYKLRRMDGQIYLDETEESYCVWRTDFSEKTKICTYWVDLFRLGPGGRWERSWEEHRERAWEPEELTAALKKAGFDRVEIRADLRRKAPGLQEDRLNFLCTKSK